LKKQVRTRDSCHSFSLQHTQSIAFSENSAFKYLRLLALSNMVILQCKQSTQYKNSFGGAIFLYQQEHIISSIFPRRIHCLRRTPATSVIIREFHASFRFAPGRMPIFAGHRTKRRHPSIGSISVQSTDFMGRIPPSKEWKSCAQLFLCHILEACTLSSLRCFLVGIGMRSMS